MTSITYPYLFKDKQEIEEIEKLITNYSKTNPNYYKFLRKFFLSKSDIIIFSDRDITNISKIFSINTNLYEEFRKLTCESVYSDHPIKKYGFYFIKITYFCKPNCLNHYDLDLRYIRILNYYNSSILVDFLVHNSTRLYKKYIPSSKKSYKIISNSKRNSEKCMYLIVKNKELHNLLSNDSTIELGFTLIENSLEFTPGIYFNNSF